MSILFRKASPFCWHLCQSNSCVLTYSTLTWKGSQGLRRSSWYEKFCCCQPWLFSKCLSGFDSFAWECNSSSSTRTHTTFAKPESKRGQTKPMQVRTQLERVSSWCLASFMEKHPPCLCRSRCWTRTYYFCIVRIVALVGSQSVSEGVVERTLGCSSSCTQGQSQRLRSTDRQTWIYVQTRKKEIKLLFCLF